MNRLSQQTLDALLERLKPLYAGRNPRDWYRDRRMLLKALTWPAAWFSSRGYNRLHLRTYSAILFEIIDDIRTHGTQARETQYFPRYFLKCVQDYFRHNEDDICARHRAARDSITTALNHIKSLATKTEDPTITILAEAHKLIQPQKTTRKKSPCKSVAPTQQTLF